MDPIPAVEREIGFDLVRRAALVAPVALVGAYVFRGVDGLAGAAVATALVAFNFLAGALTLQWAERRGPATLAVVAVGGFLVRMALVFGVIFLVRSLGIEIEGQVVEPAVVERVSSVHRGEEEQE